MIHSLQKLLDIIFPPTAHELLLRTFTAESFLHFLQPQPVGTVIILSSYHLPPVQAAIAATKFEHSFHAATLLQGLVTSWLTSLPPQPTILICVPLSQKRERARGFNQVTRVITPINNLSYPITIIPNLIIRTRDTVAQTSLSRAKRLLNMNDAFAVNKRLIQKVQNGTRIIICDDVLTTGATLNAVRTVLAQHVARDIEIICVAWAH
jgi:ComF family protein